MIYYFLLLCIPIVSCFQSISQKQYNLKAKHPNAIMFSAITSLIALLFFLVTSGFELTFDRRLVPYALGFTAGYSIAWVGTVLAVRYGLMAISSLIVSCSLIFPTIYGVMIGEKVTFILCTGIALLFLAMILVNLKFTQKEKFSFKWLFWVLLAFGGNGLCSIMQNLQKRTLGDEYKHEFMIIALSASFLILMTISLAMAKDARAELKNCVPFASLNGIANALVNFLMLTIIGNIPNTILYPTSSALSMIFTFLLAYFLYKERFSKYQYLGYIIGVVSIILLNV